MMGNLFFALIVGLVVSVIGWSLGWSLITQFVVAIGFYLLVTFSYYREDDELP